MEGPVAVVPLPRFPWWGRPGTSVWLPRTPIRLMDFETGGAMRRGTRFGAMVAIVLADAMLRHRAQVG